MAILVTGGAGFIGSHTCVELLNAGYEIVVVDNYYNANPKSLERVKELTGEDLVSRVYRPMNVPHQLCTISGCPHCYPVPEPGKKRECPVCHKEVPLENGHLVTRLFNKSDGKKHVIVTGCTECCKSK